MKIAIDARMIKPGTMHGIARYVYQLLECLIASGKNHEFFIIVNENSPLENTTWPSHMRLQSIKARWISFLEQWELPKLLKKLQVDLYHAPSFVAPLICPCRLIMTIHDLNHIVLPQFYTPLHQFYYQTFVRSCIERSEYILTVSNFSKAEIVENLNINPEKIFVTYNGVSSNYHPITDMNLQRYVRDLYQLPEKFIFCLSNSKPHKNVHQLVRAYCVSDITIPLVLASNFDPQLIKIAETYGKKHLIFFTKFILEEHLPCVYSMTDLFVYPSTYEGFGLPPLEALACGAQVVVANSSSLPEVVSGNAIFSDPYNYKDITKALEMALNNHKLRARLRAQGIKHAQGFSWEAMTNKTLDVYERCLAKV